MTRTRIQNLLQLLLLVSFFAAPCVAQEAREWEIFGGYSVQRSDVRQYYRSSPVIYTFRGQYADLKGWDASLTENLNGWFGGTLDISGHYRTPQLLGTANRERMHSVLFGPRFSYRIPHITPFAHILMGVAQAKVAVTPVGPNASDLSFAVAAGVGLDLSLGKNAAIRVLQADYFRTNLLGTRPESFRGSAGLVFYLGGRR